MTFNKNTYVLVKLWKDITKKLEEIKMKSNKITTYVKTHFSRGHFNKTQNSKPNTSRKNRQYNLQKMLKNKNRDCPQQEAIDEIDNTKVVETEDEPINTDISSLELTSDYSNFD